jgi:hypothetical protein
VKVKAQVAHWRKANIIRHPQNCGCCIASTKLQYCGDTETLNFTTQPVIINLPKVGDWGYNANLLKLAKNYGFVIPTFPFFGFQQ